MMHSKRLKTEAEVKKEIKKYIRQIGGWETTFISDGQVKTGIPDLSCVIKGRAVWIETKRQKGGIEGEHQLIQIQNINKAGGLAFFANSLEVVKEQLEKEGLL